VSPALEYLRPLWPLLMPVPGTPQLGICPVCRSAPREGHEFCHTCGKARSLAAMMGHDIPAVLPIVMSEHRSGMHNLLSQYKNSPDKRVREIQTSRLAALLAVFIDNHEQCRGDWDYAVPVPSVDRTAIRSILDRTHRFKDETKYEVLAATAPKSRALSGSQFQVNGNVTGHRILMIEDTFASGGSLLGAFEALSRAGALVVGPLVMGRHVNVTEWPPSEELMKWLRDRTWDETRCCRCAGEMRDPHAFL